MDFEQIFRNQTDPWDSDNPYQQSKFEKTLEILPKHYFENVLEIGCAEGHFTSKLFRLTDALTAVDISPTAISRARQRDDLQVPNNVRFMRLDFMHEFLTSYFDLVVCSELLYFVVDQEDLSIVADRLSYSVMPRGYLLMAHSNCQVDDPDKPGFDWDVPFGARIIGEKFCESEHFWLIKEYRTPIYRVHLFQRTHRGYEAAEPEIIDEGISVELPPEIKTQLEKRVMPVIETPDKTVEEEPTRPESQFAFVNDRIAVGNSHDCKMESELLADGITATVSVAKDLEPPNYEVIEGEHAGLIAGPGNSVEDMDLAIKTAQKLLAEHDKILIYCHSCRERSPLVTAAVYSEIEKIDWREAYAIVKDRISDTKNYPTFTSKDVGDALLKLMYDWNAEYGVVPQFDQYKKTRQKTTTHLPILRYRSISSNISPQHEEYCVHPDIFNAQIEYMESEGYRSIFLDEWLIAIRSGQPLEGKCVAITFDDGYLDFFDVAYPVLNNHQFTATMFLVSDRIGKTNDWDNLGDIAQLLSWKHIKEIQRGGVAVQFGSNSATHNNLVNIESGEPSLEYEIKDSRRKLEGSLLMPVRVFAYPYGEVNDEITEMANNAGYEIGVTCESQLSTLADDPMRLPRIQINGGDTMDVFQQKLTVPSLV